MDLLSFSRSDSTFDGEISCRNLLELAEAAKPESKEFGVTVIG
jgi:hypothetical protein